MSHYKLGSMLLAAATFGVGIGTGGAPASAQDADSIFFSSAVPPNVVMIVDTSGAS